MSPLVSGVKWTEWKRQVPSWRPLILWGIILFSEQLMYCICAFLYECGMFHLCKQATTEMPLLKLYWCKKLYVDFVLYQGRLIKIVSKYFAMVNLIHPFIKMSLFITHATFCLYACLCARGGHQIETPDLITEDYELPCGNWELNSNPLEEHPVLLTSEPPPQPLHLSF